MKKEYLEIENRKLLSRQRVLLRAFAINLFLGFVCWLLTMVPGVLYFGVWATGFSAMMMYYSVISAIALWQLLNVIFFLVPGVALMWERKYLK